MSSWHAVAFCAHNRPAAKCTPCKDSGLGKQTAQLQKCAPHSAPPAAADANAMHVRAQSPPRDAGVGLRGWPAAAGAGAAGHRAWRAASCFRGRTAASPERRHRQRLQHRLRGASAGSDSSDVHRKFRGHAMFPGVPVRRSRPASASSAKPLNYCPAELGRGIARGFLRLQQLGHGTARRAAGQLGLVRLTQLHGVWRHAVPPAPSRRRCPYRGELVLVRVSWCMLVVRRRVARMAGAAACPYHAAIPPPSGPARCL